MATPWYFRLFYIPILYTGISFLLAVIIRAKRMKEPELTKPMKIFQMISFVGFCVLLWFVPFRINLASWIGIGIVVFGLIIFALGYVAMRDHPEKKKRVVDWGIYSISRHSHILAGVITTLGVIVMGWNLKSPVYIILWIYFVLDVAVAHFAILYEEKVNIEKFGKEYEEYMKKVPRYFLIK
jgi:protein-S-isoprenylcysteine O-methyltransferase Ste14